MGVPIARWGSALHAKHNLLIHVSQDNRGSPSRSAALFDRKLCLNNIGGKSPANRCTGSAISLNCEQSGKSSNFPDLIC